MRARLVLRCRQDARASFAKLRSDVLVKMELLDSKHVQVQCSAPCRSIVLYYVLRDCCITVYITSKKCYCSHRNNYYL